MRVFHDDAWTSFKFSGHVGGALLLHHRRSPLRIRHWQRAHTWVVAVPRREEQPRRHLDLHGSLSVLHFPCLFDGSLQLPVHPRCSHLPSYLLRLHRRAGPCLPFLFFLSSSLLFSLFSFLFSLFSFLFSLFSLLSSLFSSLFSLLSSPFSLLSSLFSPLTSLFSLLLSSPLFSSLLLSSHSLLLSSPLFSSLLFSSLLFSSLLFSSLLFSSLLFSSLLFSSLLFSSLLFSSLLFQPLCKALLSQHGVQP